MMQRDRIASVPLPDRMKDMELDSRGYPVPCNVQRDVKGLPVFTCNSDRWMHDNVYTATVPKCSICGGDLETGHMAFLGGPVSAFHPQGSFADGPLHLECAEYAAQVCPYLAMPKGVYNKRLDLKAAKNDVDLNLTVDWTQHPDKPPIYIIGVCNHFKVARRAHGQLILYTPVSGPDPKFVTDEVRLSHVIQSRFVSYGGWLDGKYVDDEEETFRLVGEGFRQVENQQPQAPNVQRVAKGV